MPVAKNPHCRDFYVYALAAAGRTFYVGIGHRNRDEDRVRWVRSQRNREIQGLAPKWVRHTQVLAHCLDAGMVITHRRLKQGMSRARALEHERLVIARYLRRGFVLANHHYNSAFKGSAVEDAGDQIKK
jgi:hypothetical protein